VAFRKAVECKRTDCLDDLFLSLEADSIRLHTGPQLDLERTHFLLGTAASERAAQFLGFTTCKVRNHHCDAQQLFLEERHSKRAPQNRLQQWMGVGVCCKLRRDTGDLTAADEAFVQFANDMTAQRESAELVLPELCSLLEIFAPQLAWDEVWNCLREHLEQYREFRAAPEMEDRLDLGRHQRDLMADLLLRAFETMSIPLVQMARLAAIESADCEHGAETLEILIDRLWERRGLFQSEAVQILWECRSLRCLRKLILAYLPLLLLETDFEIRSIGLAIAEEWKVPAELNEIALPTTYIISIPSGSERETFDPPVGTSTSSSGLFTDNYRDWTWTLERPLNLVSKVSGIALATLRYRVGSLMATNLGTNPFDPPANEAQMQKLKRLSVHTGYWKLMTAAAFRAMREVIGELLWADKLDPEVVPLLQSMVGSTSPKIGTASPSTRPKGFPYVNIPDPFGRSESDNDYVERVADGLTIPTVSDGFVLAAIGRQQRGFRREQRHVEYWWGPSSVSNATSIQELLGAFSWGLVGEKRERPAPGAILRPIVLIGAFQEEQLLFCPAVAERLGLLSDPTDAFRYLDRHGNALVRTVRWRQGGIHASESDQTLHGYGCAILVDDALRDRLFPFLPESFTLASERCHEDPPRPDRSAYFGKPVPATAV
jgi:hypothetical protein